MKTAEARVSGACPTFFRASCRSAKDGATGGYQWAGYGLIGKVASLAPNRVEDGEWIGRVEAMLAKVMEQDDAAVLEWFDRNLPVCMALIPRARRTAFLRGIYRAIIDEEQNVLA